MWDIDLHRLADLLAYHKEAPMLFSSGLFLWLFTAFVLVYFCLRGKLTGRLLFVTAFSYYFYYKSSGTYFWLLATVTVSDFLIARAMARTDRPVRRRLWVALSLLINLGMLAYFKYTNFLVELVQSLTGGTLHHYDIFLPVGISFFTFQSLSYTIDVYRRQLTPLDSLLDYAFYVSFFPQLVAGPIVRARDFIPQIRRPLSVTREMFGSGVFLLMTGLFKKAVISDYISINFVERIFSNPSLYSGVENLLGIYGYALQIYCDFSGYSDMAIGLALLLGFRFPGNFDSPYKSASITEFWRRWHISLSSWLRDYLYISLGGNRRGKGRQYLNLLLTMLLGGLWHGASWNFILWGGLHGLALALHKMWQTLMRRPKGWRPVGGRRVLGVVVTFHLVCLCWIFFRQSDLSMSMEMLRRLFTAFHPELLGQLLAGYPAVFALMTLGFLLHFCPQGWEQACRGAVIRLPLLLQAAAMILLIYLVIQIKSTQIQPFIYFQF
ncbi:MAG: MBOAT family protein [Prevotellaceae bacterium]|jgi:D-alanyl-lipoteichoic acid acyltransferase DltB (MBOAT superfamily)|nr:MBOAT family protein [Prevotellaceae bacterium]